MTCEPTCSTRPVGTAHRRSLTETILSHVDRGRARDRRRRGRREPARRVGHYARSFITSALRRRHAARASTRRRRSPTRWCRPTPRARRRRCARSPCAPSNTTSSPSFAAGTPVTSTMHMSMVMAPTTLQRTAADEHLGLAGHAARVAVGVADRHRRDARRNAVALPQPAVRRRARRPAARAAPRCATSATSPAAGPRSAPTATPSSRRAPAPGGRDRSAPRRSAASPAELATCVSGAANPAAATRRARVFEPRQLRLARRVGVVDIGRRQVRAEPGQLHRRRRAQPRQHRVERARAAPRGATCRCRS